MNDVLTTVTGILFGAVGCYIAVRTYSRELKREWQNKLQAEIDKNSESRVKAYAAERDFNHLKNNQEQFKTSLIELQNEFENLKDNQIEMRVLMKASYNQLQAIAARIGDTSTGWMETKPSQPR